VLDVAKESDLSLATRCRLLQAKLQALPEEASVIIGKEQDRHRRALSLRIPRPSSKILLYNDIVCWTI
jgi:hypothetical protein